MDALKTLKTEHRIIEHVLEAFENWAQELARAEATAAPGEKEELRRFLTFIHEFVDGYHHEREERILFEAMHQNGALEDDPLSVILSEHCIARATAVRLDRLAEERRPWTSAECRAVADAVGTYVSLFRDHAQTEERFVYPRAQSKLPVLARTDVEARLERFEAEEEQLDHERLDELAGALIASHPSMPHAAAHV